MTLLTVNRWQNAADDVAPWESADFSCAPPEKSVAGTSVLLDAPDSRKIRLGLKELNNQQSRTESLLKARLIEFKRRCHAKAVAIQQFNALADQWERETRNLSSLGAITAHPAYKAIIQMREAALPLILRRMRARPGFWFEALTQIAGPANDPVKPSMYGNVQRMTEAWLKWGTKRGHI